MVMIWVSWDWRGGTISEFWGYYCIGVLDYLGLSMWPLRFDTGGWTRLKPVEIDTGVLMG